MTATVERCWAQGNKVVFHTKEAAKRALPSFKRAYGGRGKVVRCYPHDHWHHTKNLKGKRRSRKG